MAMVLSVDPVSTKMNSATKGFKCSMHSPIHFSSFFVMKQTDINLLIIGVKSIRSQVKLTWLLIDLTPRLKAEQSIVTIGIIELSPFFHNFNKSTELNILLPIETMGETAPHF